jgi:Fe-S cluster assembly scaffold protein SufB
MPASNAARNEQRYAHEESGFSIRLSHTILQCDGQSQCGRCVSKEIECIYEIPTRHSKEALREEIDQLRRRQEQNERIFAALASDNEAEIVLEQLRNHETPENILKRLDEAKAKSPTREDSEMMSVSEGDRTLTAYSHQSGQQATGSALGESTIQWARGQGMEHILGPEFGVEAPSKNRPSGNVTWTEVTSDEELVEHLITLYFCWEYPTFASLSKEHFLEDFREGRQSYCSPILVNSMLAVGCRFSTLPSARADPNDSKTAGDHFFAEALRILDQESNHHKLTTIQALGLMSIREASCGRTSESIYYAGQSVRIAIEMGLHLEGGSEGDGGASSEQSVKAATFWGAFSLDQ